MKTTGMTATGAFSVSFVKNGKTSGLIVGNIFLRKE